MEKHIHIHLPKRSRDASRFQVGQRVWLPDSYGSKAGSWGKIAALGDDGRYDIDLDGGGSVDGVRSSSIMTKPPRDELQSGSSRATISKNIATERNAGKPAKQAEAIAFSKTRGDQSNVIASDPLAEAKAEYARLRAQAEEARKSTTGKLKLQGILERMRSLVFKHGAVVGHDGKSRPGVRDEEHIKGGVMTYKTYRITEHYGEFIVDKGGVRIVTRKTLAEAKSDIDMLTE